MNLFNNEEKIFVGSHSAGEIMKLENVNNFEMQLLNNRKLLIKIIIKHQ